MAFYMAPRGGIHTQSLADLGRAPLVHTHHDPKFSQFHPFFWKIWQNRFLPNPPRVRAPPAGILDRSLVVMDILRPVCMVISCRPKSHTAYPIPESVSLTIRCCEWFESFVRKKHCIDAAASIDTTHSRVSQLHVYTVHHN